MKKRTMIVLSVLSLFFVVGSYAAQPGTDADPLITKSYIDSVVYPNTRFKLVTVPAKKSVIGTEGTEMILRMGECNVIGTQKGGVGDLTAGRDLKNGEPVTGNHHLICPINDTRGVWTATECLILIKGEYTIY